MGRLRCRRLRRRVNKLLTCCVKGEDTDQNSEGNESPMSTLSQSDRMVGPHFTDAITEARAADSQSSTDVSVTDEDDVDDEAVDSFIDTLLKRVIADEVKGRQNGEITVNGNTTTEDIIRCSNAEGDTTAAASNDMPQVRDGGEAQDVQKDKETKGCSNNEDCTEDDDGQSFAAVDVIDDQSATACDEIVTVNRDSSQLEFNEERAKAFVAGQMDRVIARAVNEELNKVPVQGKKETIDIVAEMEDSASNVASSSTSDIKGTETANYDNVAGSERVEQEATATDKQSERSICTDATEGKTGDSTSLILDSNDGDENMQVDGSVSEKTIIEGPTDSGICCSVYSTVEASNEGSPSSSSDSQVEDEGVVARESSPAVSEPQPIVIDSTAVDAKGCSVTDSEEGCTPYFTSFTYVKESAKKEFDTKTASTPQQSSAEQQLGISSSDETVCERKETLSSTNNTEQGESTEEKTLPYGDTASASSGQSNSAQGQRSWQVFEIVLVCGLLGLGLTIGTDDFKDITVQKIRMFSPAANNGQLRVGDRILKINGSSMIGKNPSEVQRLLSEVKWGDEIKILAMPAQETVAIRYSEMANAGVIVMKLNTAFDKPLGIDVEGGCDTDSPYVRISYIRPGSIADKSGLLRVGDELVQIDQNPMVGITHFEAIDILGHIYKPITLTVQRRQDLNIMDRIGPSK